MALRASPRARRVIGLMGEGGGRKAIIVEHGGGGGGGGGLQLRGWCTVVDVI